MNSGLEKGRGGILNSKKQNPHHFESGGCQAKYSFPVLIQCSEHLAAVLEKMCLISPENKQL